MKISTSIVKYTLKRVFLFVAVILAFFVLSFTVFLHFLSVDIGKHLNHQVLIFIGILEKIPPFLLAFLILMPFFILCLVKIKKYHFWYLNYLPYTRMIRKGFSPIDAMVIILRKRYPAISESYLHEIAEKFHSYSLLAEFDASVVNNREKWMPQTPGLLIDNEIKIILKHTEGLEFQEKIAERPGGSCLKISDTVNWKNIHSELRDTVN